MLSLQTAGQRFHLQRYRFIAATTTTPSSTIAPPASSISLKPSFSSSAWSSSTEGWLDTGRRWVPLAQQRARDCWETERLVCPDHVWADDAIVSCQRLLRHITKQLSSLPPQQQLSSPGPFILFALIQHDLPIRLDQFHEAVESNAVVLKKLYRVKCEYRAPLAKRGTRQQINYW